MLDEEKVLTKFLIFFFPALIDMVLGLTFFVAAVRVAEKGSGPIAVTTVIAAWALVYMVAAQWVGRITYAVNSARFIMTGCALLAISSLAFVLVPDLWATYPIIMLLAVGAALFFIPFQVFMKAMDQGDHGVLPRSVGLYTFSWSSGMAAGPFVSAFIWNRFGWQSCYALGIALSVITAIGILFLKHHAEAAPAPVAEPLPEKAGAARPIPVDYSGMPDLAWLGWLCSGVGCLAVAVLRSYLPSSTTIMGIPRIQQGILLALISGSQALTGLVLCRSRMWMYRALPISVFGACGILALLAFGFSGDFPVLALAAICFGIYSGSFFFFLVFHSLVHPERSTRYVAVNESVVGLTNMLGPLLAGFLAAGFTISAPYWVSALLVLMAVAFHASAIRRHCRVRRLPVGRAYPTNKQ